MNKTIDSQEQLEEGMGDTIRLGTLIALLAVPGLMSAKDLGEKLPKDKVTAIDVQNGIEEIGKEQKLYNGYTSIQIANVVARTLFMEARSDYKNNGLQAVASVIWNRAGGKTENLIKVCWEKNQFSVWKDSSPWNGGEKFSPKGYNIVIPKQASQNKIEAAAWEACKKWASQMVDGTFKSNIGNRNMYDYTESGKRTSWWNKMQNKTKEGEFGKVHIFGYLPEHDGFKKPTEKQNDIYIVKRGDTLNKIAAANKTTAEKLISLNPNLKKNPDKISVGMKLKLPT